MIRIMNELTAYEWIEEDTVSIDSTNWDGGKVCNLIPNRYTHYCKIMNSTFYRDRSIQDESLLWNQIHPNDEVEIDLGKGITLKELAEKYDIPYDKKISSKSIERKLGGCPRYLIYPDGGRINLDVLKEMTKVLAPFTKDKPCYFFYNILKLIGRIRAFIYRRTPRYFQYIQQGGHGRIGIAHILVARRPQLVHVHRL